MRRFNKVNSDYLTDIMQNEEQIGEDSYWQEFNSVEYNNVQIQSVSSKVQDAYDRMV